MSEIRVIGVAPKNGRAYPIFTTDKVMTHGRKDTYKKALEKRYSREFYLYYTELDSEFNLSVFKRDFVPLEEMNKYLV